LKPLTKIDEFLKRFDNFKDGEVRLLEVISPTTMKITLAGQDSARDFDWITVSLEFSNVSDAKLLEQNRLALIDMSDGVNIINENNSLAFAIGECYNISAIKTSVCYIVSSSIKYEEGLF